MEPRIDDVNGRNVPKEIDLVNVDGATHVHPGNTSLKLGPFVR